MIKLRKNLFEDDGYLTQGFGEHPDWYARYGLLGHNGIDYGIPNGRELYSCIYGMCTERAFDEFGYGNYVKIENDGCGVIYAHLEKFNIKVGDKIEAGKIVGFSDNTGNSTGPHLHFGVFPKPRDRTNGYAGYIDPLGKEIEWVDVLDDPFLNTEIDDLKQEIEELKESVKHYKESRDEALKDAKNKQKEIDNIGSKLDRAKEEIKELEIRVRELVASSNYTISEHINAIIKIILDRLMKGV